MSDFDPLRELRPDRVLPDDPGDLSFHPGRGHLPGGAHHLAGPE